MIDNEQFKIRFKWVGCATWVLDINGLKIACDPVLCPEDTVQVYGPGSKSRRLTAPAFDESDFENVDLWLISHEHEDHLDEPGLCKIDTESIVIANKKAKKTLLKSHSKQLNIIKWGEVLEFSLKGMAIEIEAMPTAHASNALMAFVLRGGNGYWLKIKKKDALLQIYVTGDTINHKKVINALQGYKADILIANIGAAFRDKFGGPVTFTIETLQTVINTIDPDIILPVHFGTFSHFSEASSDVRQWNDGRVKILAEGDCFEN